MKLDVGGDFCFMVIVVFLILTIGSCTVITNISENNVTITMAEQGYVQKVVDDRFILWVKENKK